MTSLDITPRSTTVAPSPVGPGGVVPSDATTLDIAEQLARERTLELEQEIAAEPGRFRVLTGDRPTGRLHIGHLFGTVANRVRLQGLGVETFVVIADYQVIADRDNGGDLAQACVDLVIDHLAAGIDPARSTIFQHSAVPELHQLMLPFLSLVTVAELERNPTVKAELAATGGRAMSGLLLTYPVHQAADILACRGTVVPVGRDQLPHLETTRLVARRFNARYGAGTLAEPEALLSETPLVLGLDGTKMSKSAGNAIALTATPDEIARAVRGARTDAERTITYEPERRPYVANLLRLASFAGAGTPEQVAAQIGGQGAGALKALLTETLVESLAPVRERAALLRDDRAQVAAVLREGNERARTEATATLAQVRTAMRMVV
ncbi:MAG: tryptophan--tRNA ligase [Cellulomonas sp.]|nr:tryptophan--tRNA ligase [Cellulomonas sp.]